MSRRSRGLVPWAAAMLAVTYLGYSLLGIAHQSWGAMLGGDEAQRSRIVAWREGLGLDDFIAELVWAGWQSREEAFAARVAALG